MRPAVRAVLLAMAGLALAPGLAPVPGARGVSGQETAELASRVDAETLARVRPVLDAALRDSLPVDELRAKVLEGVAKRRPPELIGRVVEDLARELRDVRAELRRALPEAPISGPEVSAARLARQRGAPVEAIAEVLSSRPPGVALEVPVTVLGELVGRGVPAGGASELVRHIVSTRVPLERAVRIPDRLDGALGRGVAAPAALERALRELGIPGPPADRPGRGPRGSGPPGPPPPPR